MNWDAQPPAGHGPSADWRPALPRKAYTPWISRLCAWLIDALPLVIGVVIWQSVAIGTGGMDCVTYDNGGVACTATHSSAGNLLFVVVMLVSPIYAVWNFGYRQGTTGSSLGKSVMKFKVVGERTWQPIGFGFSIVRGLAHTADLLVCGLGYLWPLWDAKRQTLADKIVGTVCVSIRPQAVDYRGPFTGRR